MSEQQRYPLAWPSGWKRTSYRKVASFGKAGIAEQGWKTRKPLEIGDGLNRLNAELKRLGATDVVISTDLALNRDGSINRGQRMPADPGVAVYFKLKGRPRCMASDSWTRIPDNMAAIAGTIEALRSIDRYGVGNIEQAFAGYTALQPAAEEDWHIVLGVARHAPTAEVETVYKRRIREWHPDQWTGEPNIQREAEETTRRLNVAYAAFKKERGL